MKCFLYKGRDNAVGIVACCGVDGSGIESQWGARFSAPVHTSHGAHPASYRMGTGTFPGVKQPGGDVDGPPHLELRLKKEYSYTTTPLWAFIVYFRVKLYLYFLYEVI